MSQIFLSPNKYIQGKNTIELVGSVANKLGNRALFIGGKKASNICADTVLKSLKEQNMDGIKEEFRGECSDTEINRLLSIAKDKEIDIVIAAGGGKSIDTGKMVANESHTPVIIIPTIASTDAPCSAGAVVYTDEGSFDRAVLLTQNPNCVLVDTLIIAESPVEFLVSGMGDALATYWEADTCNRSSRPNFLTGAYPPTLCAMAISRLCYDTLLEHGLPAKLAVEKKVCTPSVDAIVEANILLSGIGFESGGLAAAHSIHNGFTVLKQTHHLMHGQKVAFGTIVQMVLEGRPLELIYEVFDFCSSVGLPICLSDLDILSPEADDIRSVALASTAKGESIHSTWFPVTAEMVESAIWAADALGIQYKETLSAS